MEKERKNRYLEKIKLAYKRLGNIENEFSESDREIIRLGIYKAFQELIESLTDISAMIIVDEEAIIGDDYSNIENIKNIIGLNDNEIETLKEANGLRNRIIHKYNKTDDERAKESIENLLPHLEKIIEKFSKFIDTKKNGI